MLGRILSWRDLNWSNNCCFVLSSLPPPPGTNCPAAPHLSQGWPASVTKQARGGVLISRNCNPFEKDSQKAPQILETAGFSAKIKSVHRTPMPRGPSSFRAAQRRASTTFPGLQTQSFRNRVGGTGILLGPESTTNHLGRVAGITCDKLNDST